MVAFTNLNLAAFSAGCSVFLVILGLASVAPGQPADGFSAESLWRLPRHRQAEWFQSKVVQAELVDLMAMAAGKDLSAAMYARWEMARRLAVESGVSPSPRFLVPESLQACYPDWWIQSTRRAVRHCAPGKPLFVDASILSDTAASDGVLECAIRSIERDELLARIGEREVVVPTEQLFAVRQVHARETGDYCLIAAHSAWSMPFRLMCYGANSPEPKWSTDVLTAANCWNYSGRGFNKLHFAVADDLVVVAGVAVDAIYTEAFSLRDGTCRFRFSTAYYYLCKP